MVGNIVGIIVAFLVAVLTTPFVKKIAVRVGAVDQPDERKVHTGLMPRLGGVAIYLGFVVAVLITQELTLKLTGVLIGGTFIVLIGILDDIKTLSPVVKLVGQIAAAAILVLFGVEVLYITNPFGSILPVSSIIHLGYLSIPVTIFWIVGVTNAVNLVDGLDGLAGGLATIAAFCLAIIGWLEGQYLVVMPAIILGASTIGFLKHNFYPAKIFMGDSGSMFLGYVLSALSIIGLTKSITVISVFVPIFIIGIPIFDTCFAIVRRYMNHQPIFKADKEHLHHCLLDRGLSHRQTVLAIYGVNIILGASGVLLTILTTAQSFMFVLIVTLGIFLAANRIGVLGSRTAHSLDIQNQNNKYSA